MSEKVEFPAFRKSKVKPGTQPNKSEPKLVTIKSEEDGTTRRIKLNIAETMVSTGLWSFCPKSEFKGK